MQQEQAIKAELACRLCCCHKIKWIKENGSKRCIKSRASTFHLKFLPQDFYHTLISLQYAFQSEILMYLFNYFVFPTKI